MIQMTRQRKLLAVLAVFALIVAACGGDDDTAADTTTTEGDTELTTTTVAEATGEPIQLFVISNTTGGTFQAPERFGAAQAAAEAINQRGGVNGRPLEILTCDHEFDTNKQLGCVNEAADSDAVALLAHFFLIGDQATPILDEAGMPEYGSIFTGYTTPRELAYNPPWAESPYSPALLTKAVGADTTTMVANTLLPALTPDALAVYEDAEVDFLGRVDVAQDTADFAPIAQAAAEQNAALVDIQALGPTEGANVVRAMDAIGFTPKLLANAGTWTEETFEAVGDSVDGRFFIASSIVPPSVTDHPEIKRFTEEMDAAQRAGIAGTEEPRTQFALEAWVAVNAFAALAETIDGDITRESVTEALDTAEDLDLGGVVPAWTPAADEDPDTEGRQVYNDFYVVTYKDGALTLFQDEPVCGAIDGC